MYRQQAVLALTALFAATTLVVAPLTAFADGDDDYYEDEYADDTEESDEAEELETPAEELPWRLRYARSGAYFYLGGSYLFVHAADRRNAENGGAVNIRFGARFKKYFAMEVEYQTAPKMKFITGDPAQIAAGLKDPKEGIDIHSITVNARAYFPLGRFQPFGQLGTGVFLADPPGSKLVAEFELRFGGGLEYFVTEDIGVSVAAFYTVPWGKYDDFRYTSLVMAVGYHF